MPYRNAREVLPLELLREVQEYVQGEQIYVPTKDDVRAKWGSKSGATEMIRLRNADICAKREDGHAVEELAGMFYLSEESIRKIISSRYGSGKE